MLGIMGLSPSFSHCFCLSLFTDQTSGNSSLDTLLALLQAEGAKIEEETEVMSECLSGMQRVRERETTGVKFAKEVAVVCVLLFCSFPVFCPTVTVVQIHGCQLISLCIRNEGERECQLWLSECKLNLFRLLFGRVCILYMHQHHAATMCEECTTVQQVK